MPRPTKDDGETPAKKPTPKAAAAKTPKVDVEAEAVREAEELNAAEELVKALAAEQESKSSETEGSAESPSDDAGPAEEPEPSGEGQTDDAAGGEDSSDGDVHAEPAEAATTPDATRPVEGKADRRRDNRVKVDGGLTIWTGN